MAESNKVIKYLKYILVLLVVILIVGVLNLVQNYMSAASPTGNANLPPRTGYIVCDSSWCMGGVYCNAATEVCACTFYFPWWLDVCKPAPPPKTPTQTTNTSIAGDIESATTELPGYVTDTSKATNTDFDTWK